MSWKLKRTSLWTSLITVILTVASPGFGQNLVQQRDLGFAQVAVGGGYETVLTLTNRGSYEYAGFLLLTSGEDGQPWNPKLNGETVQNGQFYFEIAINETVTFRLTGDAEAESGLAILLFDDPVIDNFLEGNLTYFVRDGERLTDSIGVSPSTEFFLASVPFEDSSTVALALANADFRTSDANTATVTIKLFNDAGAQLATQPLTVNPLAHSARFLSQIFDENVGRGKIEISSDVPIIGTALTFVSGQLSSLPMLPSPVAYSLRMVEEGGAEATGGMTLWAEGDFVKGYLWIYEKDGIPLVLEDSFPSFVHGQIFEGGWLDLSFFTKDEAFENSGRDVNLQMHIPGEPPESAFSFTKPSASGDYLATFYDDKSTRSGTFTLTRTTE